MQRNTETLARASVAARNCVCYRYGHSKIIRFIVMTVHVNASKQPPSHKIKHFNLSVSCCTLTRLYRAVSG